MAPLLYLVHEEGIKPSTSALRRRRSLTELLVHELVCRPGIEPGSTALQAVAEITRLAHGTLYLVGNGLNRTPRRCRKSFTGFCKNHLALLALPMLVPTVGFEPSYT